MDRLNKVAIGLALILFVVLAWQGLSGGGHELHRPRPALLAQYGATRAEQLLQALPQQVDLDARKVRLGERLFKDTRLSGKGFSCNTCHPVESGGMDGLPRSRTVDGGQDDMNTPSIFNVGFYPYLNWRADQPDLEAQIDSVIANARHMGSSWPQVEQALAQDASYRKAFNDLYGEAPRAADIRDALAEYERSLITPDSDFDRWLRGEWQALSELQQEGYRLFQRYGCSSCHQGVNIGGNLVARYGVFGFAYSHRPGSLTAFDQGLASLTGRFEDRFLFRVPSLRNVAVTAPYFHDGSVDTLDAAIEHMGRVQLGREIPEQERRAIAAFLESLTGRYQGRKL